VLSLRRGRSAFNLAAERGWAEQQIAELKRERDALYSEVSRRQTQVLPGVPETLRSLHGRRRMAVVTSSQRQHFDVMHADFGLTGYLEFVPAREDYGEAKPSPESYLLAVLRLEMKAESCVAVEDSERGLAGARCWPKLSCYSQRPNAQFALSRSHSNIVRSSGRTRYA